MSTADAVAVGVAEAPRRAHMSIWWRFRRHRLALFGFVVLGVFSFMAVAAPIVAVQDAFEVDLKNIKAAPTFSHVLGTDAAGRDLWARLVYASRVSLAVGLVAALIASAIGTVVGVVSGYAGGWVDNLLMRITELVMTLPTFFLLIVAASLFGRSVINIMLIIGLLGWTGKARLVRGQVLSIKELDYVTAARAIGAGARRISIVHIFPGTVPYVVVSATLTVGGAILSEAGLSFLGLGVQFTTPTWGNLMNAAQSLYVLQHQPWVWLPPGLAIGMTVLSVNFVGDGLRDALDPRTKID